MEKHVKGTLKEFMAFTADSARSAIVEFFEPLALSYWTRDPDQAAGSSDRVAALEAEVERLGALLAQRGNDLTNEVAPISILADSTVGDEPSPVRTSLTQSAPSSSKAGRSIVFFALFVPRGAILAFVNYVLPDELTAGHRIELSDEAKLLSIPLVLALLRWLWAPLIDLFYTRKAWYVSATFACTLISWIAFGVGDREHPSLILVWVLLVAFHFAAGLMFIAAGSLMAATVDVEQSGRAAGWSQAGTLCGYSVGAGLGMLHRDGTAIQASSTVLLALCAICCWAARWIEETRYRQPATDHVEAIRRVHVGDKLAAIGRELKAFLSSPMGILASLLCLLPIASGAAHDSMPVAERDWHVSVNTLIAFNNCGNLIYALGCLLGGWFCDRVDRRAAYCLFGILAALTSVGMALLPHTETQYVIWTSLYSFFAGACQAVLFAVILEVIGRTAVATKFSLLTTASLLPGIAMPYIVQNAYAKGGADLMLYQDALIGVASVVLLALLARKTKAKAATVGNVHEA